MQFLPIKIFSINLFYLFFMKIYIYIKIRHLLTDIVATLNRDSESYCDRIAIISYLLSFNIDNYL